MGIGPGGADLSQFFSNPAPQQGRKPQTAKQYGSQIIEPNEFRAPLSNNFTQGFPGHEYHQQQTAG